MSAPSKRTHCDRCGKDCRYNKYSDTVLHGDLIEVKPMWRVHGVTFVCSSCGDAANKFIDYFGKKTVKDKRALRRYLQSGSVSSLVTESVFSMLTNAGYHKSNKGSLCQH